MYNPVQKDFFITSKCFCNENCENFLYQIISENPSYCEEHRNGLNFLCERCNILLCEECLVEHKEHKIKNIINEEVISEEIIAKINEKKDEFKGNKIIEKIINFYKSDKNNEIINNHNSKISESLANPQTDKKSVIQENSDTNIVKPESININNNFINNTNISANNINNNSNNNNEEEENNEEIDLSLIEYQNIKTLNAHKDRISALIKLNNGYIASGSYDGAVKIWDILKDDKDSLVMIKDSITAVFCFLEFEPGKLLGGTNLDGCILLWDLNDKNSRDYIFTFDKHDCWVNALVKLDEKHFASSSNDKKIIIWDYENKKLENILEGHTDCIMAMIKLKNGNLCTSSTDENIMIWDWKNLRCLFRFRPHKKYVKCLLELNNEYLLTGSEDNTIGIWEKSDFEQYKNISYLKGHRYPIRALCQINKKYFASGSFDNRIKIWDFEKKECVQTLEGHQSNVICVIKYKSDMLISCSSDKTIKIWKAG